MTNSIQNTEQSLINSRAWKLFCATEQLTDTQQQQFALYLTLLLEWNAKFNITAITDPEIIITDHFKDSLQIRQFMALDKQQGIADIGSGGGFPGLPLKICYPSIPFVLIEVNNKKIQFLQTVIDVLELPFITIYPLDWRTFLRKSDYSLDLFLARASLQPEDLIRVLKPSSPYHQAVLAYWASRTWFPSGIVAPFIEAQNTYNVGGKQRKLVFLKAQ